MRVFTVKDLKAGFCRSLVTHRNAAEAVRAFGDAVNGEDSVLNRHPNDFRLYELGEFDEVTMRFKPHDDLIDHGSAADVLRKPPEQGSLKMA